MIIFGVSFRKPSAASFKAFWLLTATYSVIHILFSVADDVSVLSVVPVLCILIPALLLTSFMDTRTLGWRHFVVLAVFSLPLYLVNLGVRTVLPY